MWVLAWSALMGALASSMGSLVGRAIIALGIGTITYTGVSVGIDSMRSKIVSSVQGLPADALGLVGYLWMDKMLTIVFSAVVISLSMRLIGGSVKKMVMK